MQNINPRPQPVETPDEWDEKTAKYRHNDPLGALFLITLGVIFLLNNFGLLSWSIWTMLWKFWPVFLILAGLRIILGRSSFANFLIGIIGFGLLASLVYSQVAASNPQIRSYTISKIPQLEKLIGLQKPDTVTKFYSVTDSEFPNMNAKSIDIAIDTSSYTVKDATSSNYLALTATFPKQENEPVLNEQKNNDELNIGVTITHNNNTTLFPDVRSYDLVIGKANLPTDLRIHVGTGSGKVELTQTQLKNLGLSIGTGSMQGTITQVSAGTSKWSINVGTGSLNLTVPKDIGIKVDHNVGIGSLSLFGTQTKGNGTYTSPNYFTAANKIDITISVSIGSVTLVQ